ncbi:MAG: hypothetical protein ACTSYG_10785 [Candidatus Heimdallarchaeota archaeon]
METQVNLSEIKGIESEGIDLNKWHKKQTKIENVEVVQVPSTFTAKDEKGEYLKQWVLKVYSEVLESIGEDENKIEFRASELFNLVQDKDGNLKGFPKNERSNLMKFCKDLRIDTNQIENLQQLVDAIKGKEATIKSYDKDFEADGKTSTRTYLKFLY